MLLRVPGPGTTGVSCMSVVSGLTVCVYRKPLTQPCSTTAHSAASTTRTSVSVHDRREPRVESTEHDQILLIRVLDGLDAAVARRGLDPCVAHRHHPEVALCGSAADLAAQHGSIQIAVQRQLGVHEATARESEEHDREPA